MLTYDEIFYTINNYANKNANITNQTYASRVFKVLKTGKSLQNYDDVTSFLITNHTQKTYKSYITSIVVFLKASSQKELAQKYASEMKRVNDIIQTKEKEHKKTDSEVENMVTRSEVEKIIKNLKNLINKPVVVGDMEMFINYQKYLVLNLYHLIPPVRNDFIGCEVYESPVLFPDNMKNYIYTNIKKFVLNRYKTKKTYGKMEIDLPGELVDIVMDWMTTRQKIFPKITTKELLLNKNLQPMSQVNLTQFLNRIFQRKVSTTILRKSYISEKYPVTQTTNEMERDARAMQHSIGVQQTVYRKKN